MAGLVQFNFEGLNVRVQDKDGNPWFILADVCRVLDVKNVSDASRRLDADERGIVTTDTPSGTQEMLIVNESGLYSLVLTSRKPEAKRFKKFVTAEVLPSIRKTGSYSVNPAPQPATSAVIDLRDPVQMAKVALQLVEINRELETRIAEAAPMVDFYKRFAESDGLFTLSNAGKALGMGPRKFIDRLKEKGVLFYQGGDLVAKQDYIDRGFFVTRAKQFTAANRGMVSVQTYVTAKGVQALGKRIAEQDPHRKLAAEIASRKSLPAPTQRNLI